MTIAISICTNAAAIFAADSKLTTSGLVGFDASGEPQFVNQTYDSATKIVQDAQAMAMVAGSATLGPMSVMDYVATRSVPRLGKDKQEQGSANSRTACRRYALNSGPPRR